MTVSTSDSSSAVNDSSSESTLGSGEAFRLRVAGGLEVVLRLLLDGHKVSRTQQRYAARRVDDFHDRNANCIG
jgi:hypothetical protein